MSQKKEWSHKGIPVLEHEKIIHRSKSYYEAKNSSRPADKPIYEISKALDYFLQDESIPEKERRSITGFSIFKNDQIIAIHCAWAPKLWGQRNQIFQEIGWYPLVTGRFLGESQISKNNDRWLTGRYFHELDFPEFDVKKISLRRLSTKSGIAILLIFNDNFKILLDCCLDLNGPEKWCARDQPDLIFISHAHRDHFNSLMDVVSLRTNIPIILSHTTLDLISYFERKNIKIESYLEKNAYPLYFNDFFSINEDIVLQIFKAGHYPGAAMLHVTTPYHDILYTGDFSLYELQPVRSGWSCIQNLNGTLDSLIIEGQFCNWFLESQKFLLDKACEEAFKALEAGAPVLVLGDPGSWLLILYIKFFYFFSSKKKKWRIYLDEHTLEIMKILRYRHEDLSESISQQISRFHDPFISIIRQDFEKFKFDDHSKSDPPIIFYNSNRYENPPNDTLKRIFEDPSAFLIITGPIRNEALKSVWTDRVFGNGNDNVVKCKIFGWDGSKTSPDFCLHAGKIQIHETFRHLKPSNVFLFHASQEYLKRFIENFEDKRRKFYSLMELKVLDSQSEYILFEETI
ncbi:MAG: MBL fold metallo-hydrolase [Candidatus Helarchaeota archaeon]